MSNDIYMSDIVNVLTNCPISMLVENVENGASVYYRRVVGPIQKILDINSVCIGDRIYRGGHGTPTNRAIGDIMLNNVSGGLPEYLSGAKDIRGPIPVEDLSRIRVIVGTMVSKGDPEDIGCTPMMSFSAYSIREAVKSYRATCSYKHTWIESTLGSRIDGRRNNESFSAFMGDHPDRYYFYTGYSIGDASSPDDRMKNMVKRIAKRYCNRA